MRSRKQPPFSASARLMQVVLPATGISVPFVVAFVARTTHRLRKAHDDHTGHGES